jgi:hypothetical protein
VLRAALRLLWRERGEVIMMGHIDPAAGRNKRETAKLVKRLGGGGNQIRRRSDGTGLPAERRIDQKRRIKAKGK